MAWWANRDKVARSALFDGRPPGEVVRHFKEWVESFEGAPVMVARPIEFDWQFVNYYFHRFVGYNPFGYHGEQAPEHETSAHHALEDARVCRQAWLDAYVGYERVG